MSLSLSLVSTLFGSGSNQSGANGLLQILDGGGGQQGVTDPSQSLQALSHAEANQTQDIQATAQQTAVQRAISQFTAAVKSATSVQQLLSNPNFLQVFLTANGLGDQTQYTALAQKALMSNPNDSNSLANQLSNTSWQSAVKTYDFADKGLSVIQQPQVISTIANAYAEETWRQSLDATTPGLSDALTFRQEASGITSVDQILGDPVLRTVVTTALGIPEQIAFQPLEAQEKAISSQLDISKFKDPLFVETFTQRYLIAASQQASSTNGSTPDLSSLAVQAQGLVV
ncbi:MAG: DUF1217 domain-containing protein [Acetobacteraceae bacterium]|nr:DUF1217 domain-containing protein [Acetobacteraceae bacterium]